MAERDLFSASTSARRRSRARLFDGEGRARRPCRARLSDLAAGAGDRRTGPARLDRGADAPCSTRCVADGRAERVAAVGPLQPGQHRRVRRRRGPRRSPRRSPGQDNRAAAEAAETRRRHFARRPNALVGRAAAGRREPCAGAHGLDGAGTARGLRRDAPRAVAQGLLSAGAGGNDGVRRRCRTSSSSASTSPMSSR